MVRSLTAQDSMKLEAEEALPIAVTPSLMVPVRSTPPLSRFHDNLTQRPLPAVAPPRSARPRCGGLRLSGLQKVLFESRYDVSGHAGEHLSSASVAFPAFAMVSIVLYVTPQARRQPLVLATSALWLVSAVLVLVGNVRVIDALVDAGMAHTPTSQLVGNATIDSSHDLANLAPWLGVVAALALTGALWRQRHISGRVAVGAAVLSVIVPPWIIPGAGVIVITVACCIAFHRAIRTDLPSRTAPIAPSSGVVPRIVQFL